MRELRGVALGVEQAFGYWLYDHDVTTPGCITDAVAKAFESWLDSNSEVIIEAIAKEVAKHGRSLDQGGDKPRT